MFKRFNLWISGSFECVKCGRHVHLLSFGYGKTICPNCYDGETEIISLDNGYWLNRLYSRLSKIGTANLEQIADEEILNEHLMAEQQLHQVFEP